ncbi:MAG TPA: sortase [Candidatus Dojkabacteria bacterium]|nr:sortase [Candidatus Dojkabacteria bacterium]
MLKIIYRITTVVLLLSVLAGILFFIIYPKYPDIQNYLSQLQPYRIASNTTLHLFLKISPPNLTQVESEIGAPGTLEEISPDEIAQLRNEGKIRFNMEEQNTQLYIPSVNINGKVVDDETSHGMDKGFWHFPLSSEPGLKGNTVIIAHRFLYLPPRTDTFFNLDKIKVGDKVIINQKGGTYRYTVVETKVVEKNDRSILLNTNDYRLTLVTCTPLWTANQRQVIVAKLDKIYGDI